MAADGGGMNDEYWAARKGSDLVTALAAKTRYYFDEAERRGLRRMWELAYCQYYGLNPGAVGDMATQSLAFVGPNNEFIRFRLGEVRSFIKQDIAITAGERPAFKGIAMNTDYATGAQVRIADQVIGYLYQTGSGEDMEQLALEGNKVVAMASAHVQWDYDGGEEVDTEVPHPGGAQMPDPSGAIDEMTGEPVLVPAMIPTRRKSGIPTTSITYPWETIGEPYARGGKHLWRIVHERASKYELAATYEEKREDILGLQWRNNPYSNNGLFGASAQGQSDDLLVEHFYHAPSRAIPRGRYVGVVQDVILWDEECPLPDRIPVVDLCSSRFMGTAFGYSDSWDLISVQEMIDQLCSDGASNFAKFGRPMIVADEGLVLDQTLLSRGHHIWTKPTEADFPQAISFVAMPPGWMDFLQYLHARQQSISGLNSTVRGEPDKNITSGQMAALFHSITIEFKKSEQRALNSFRKELANMYLDMVRMFSTAPFVAEIAGHAERPYMQAFAMQDLKSIRRVVMEPVSSLSQSTPGRLAIGELLMKIPDPQLRAALLKGIETGQWGDFTKRDRNADLRVSFENEQLAQGIPCAVLATDDPYIHIPQHLADIDARTEQLNTDPMAVQAYLEHIQEHLSQYQMLNPNLARVLKIPAPLPIMGTPAGQANLMLTGAVEPVPANDQAPEGAPSDLIPENQGMPQGRDSTGVKLPNPSAPPKGSSVQPEAAGAAPNAA